MKLWSFLKGRKADDARADQPEEVGSSKDLDAALAAIAENSKEPPTKALEWLRRHRSLSIPALIQIVESAGKGSKTRENSTELSYALYLLAEMRATEVYPAVIALCGLPEREIEEILGDIVAQDLDRILASICGSDVEPLKAVIADVTKSEWTRAAAVGAFPLLVFDGRLTREQVIEHFRHLLEGGLERAPTFVWIAVVAEACTLHPGEFLAPIRRAYEEGLVDETVQSLKEVLADAKKAQAAHVAHNKKHSRGLIQDALQDMSWMSGVGQAGEEEGEDDADVGDDLDDVPDEDVEEEVFVAEPVRSSPKVGRNDPCPCGSGKKFKKCCGA